MKINTTGKNFRIILFSIIGLAVLAGVVLVLTLTAPDNGENTQEEVTTTTADPALVLQPENNGAIESIRIENANGEFTVKRTENGSGEKIWTVEGMEDVKESLWVQSSFESLANALTGMTARSVVEENPSDMEQYGLTNPIATAAVSYENGKSFTLSVGGNVVSGSASYIKTSDSDTVYSYYTHYLSSITDNDPMSFINTVAMPSFDSSNAPDIRKITVTRKDWEQPLILEALSEPESEDSIQVYPYAFTSPYDVYLDLTEGSAFLNSMFGLGAEKAVYVNPTEEQMKETGLDDPFCQVDMLTVNQNAENQADRDAVFRLYIGSAVTEEVTDEETGVTSTVTKGFYGISNQVRDVIYYFDADSVIWATMEPTKYMSKLFLMPYIYDLDTVTYRDGESEITVTVEGNAESNKITLNGEESDLSRFQSFYQYLVSCRGEEIYTDDARGDFIAEFSYTYDDEREKDTVTLYEAEDRAVIVAVNGKNIFKTKWNYGTRLLENAKAYLSGGEIVLNY